jgi:hypothetical protein
MQRSKYYYILRKSVLIDADETLIECGNLIAQHGLVEDGAKPPRLK